MRIPAVLAATAASLSFATPAQALTIVGDLSFLGFVVPVGSPGMNGATGLDFLNGSSMASNTGDPGVPGTIFGYVGSSGVFGGITCSGACGTIQDLTDFNTGPILSFFEISNTVFFDLTSVDSVTYQPDSKGGSLKLVASGVFRIPGFDDASGVLTLTSQGQGLTTFSATAGTSPVPEPASWALMIAGFGLAGGLLRASRRSVRVRYARP